MENIQFVNDAIARVYKTEYGHVTIFQESSGEIKGILVDNEFEMQLYEYLESELECVQICKY